MLNNSSKFITSRRLPISIMGLLLTLGVVGEQTKPVLSNEIEEVPTSTELVDDFSRSTSRSGTKASILLQLREVREQRSQLRADTIANESSEAQVPTNYLSSATLSKNVKLAPVSNQKAAKDAGIMPRANYPKKDGVYLYGQSPTPNQLGQGYVIFQKQQNRVTGALYMPQSEFSCFQGTLAQSGELAMTVTSSPDESGSTQVAATNRLPNFADDEPITYAYSVALQDYHQLNSISASDRRILQMCNQPSTEVYTKLVK